MVSRTPRLLPSLPPACGQAALRWLEVGRQQGTSVVNIYVHSGLTSTVRHNQARGVVVLLGDEVVEEAEAVGSGTSAGPLVGGAFVRAKEGGELR